ncbi:MAG: hypothetical protein OCC45_15720 [Desulfotalea sp.]
MVLGIEVVLKYMEVDPTIIWEKLLESHPEFLLSDQRAMFYDREISLSKIRDIIKIQGRIHFDVEFEKGSIHYGQVRTIDLSFLEIEKCITGIEDATRWINPFLKLESFISARVYDIEYEKWQNAEDPLLYDVEGRPYSHLPMKSNGLPFPLEQDEIDISNNPGRRVSKSGYVEAIGSIMWIGNAFWGLTNAKKNNVCSQEWLTCKARPNNVISIKVAEDVFIHDTGAELKAQNDLRELLFPSS